MAAGLGASGMLPAMLNVVIGRRITEVDVG
jgi:hypothetical protein